MNEEELKALYEEYVAGGGKLSYSKWKRRHRKNDKRKNARQEDQAYEKMLKDREKAINEKRASLLEHNELNNLKGNPLYEKINNILGEDTDYFDAQGAINRARRSGVIESNEDLESMKRFLSENEGLFYDYEGERIKYSKPEELFDVDSEINKFTKEYDKEHNVVFRKEAEKESKKQTKKKVKEKIKEETKEVIEDVTKEGMNEAEDKLEESVFKKIFNKRSVGVIINTGMAISDYKDARNQGNGVVKSAAKAGAMFVTGEVLQGAAFPVMLAKQLPSMVVSSVDSLQKVTREMNSSQRFQTFGEAEFHDTRQLATMRQAGMELAKMSQYNLQQSIMGNEAQYMHRI